MSGCKPAPHWTEARVELMRRLRFVEGVSAAKIAAALSLTGHTFTRNAVIAKCDRLGWTAPCPDRVSRSAAKKRQTAIKLAAAPKLKAEPIRSSRTPPRGPMSVPFIDRKPWQCPMFCSGEEGPEGFVCGAPAENSVWCNSCVKLVFVPVPPMRKVA